MAAAGMPGMGMGMAGMHGHDAQRPEPRQEARHADPHRLPDPVRLAAPEAGGAAQDAEELKAKVAEVTKQMRRRPEEQHRSRHPKEAGHRGGLAKAASQRGGNRR